eukprot:5787910-Amphidinium_carterae.1
MDMFYDKVCIACAHAQLPCTLRFFWRSQYLTQVPVQGKKRIHFHEWMIDVHSRLHRRQKGSSVEHSVQTLNVIWQPTDREGRV